jgi:hypothetical protein
MTRPRHGLLQQTLRCRFNCLSVAASCFEVADARVARTRNNSLRGKVGDDTNGRPQIGVTPLGQAVTVRSLSSQSLSSLPGLP